MNDFLVIVRGIFSVNFMLLFIQDKFSISDSVMNVFLECLKEYFLSVGNCFLKFIYAVKKMFLQVGQKYEKTDVCFNDCMIYWGEYVYDKFCEFCGMDRYDV